MKNELSEWDMNWNFVGGEKESSSWWLLRRVPMQLEHLSP